MADKVKTVRLRNTKTGVEVVTTETVAANLSGYELAGKPAKSSDSSK
jgi:hypothetical protein